MLILVLVDVISIGFQWVMVMLWFACFVFDYIMTTYRCILVLGSNQAVVSSCTLYQAVRCIKDYQYTCVNTRSQCCLLYDPGEIF